MDGWILMLPSTHHHPNPRITLTSFPPPRSPLQLPGKGTSTLRTHSEFWFFLSGISPIAFDPVQTPAVRMQSAEAPPTCRCLFSARFLQSTACLAEWMPPGYCISQWYLWFYRYLQDVISGSKPQTEQDLQGNTKLCSACAPGLLQLSLASNTNLFFSPVQTP